MKLAFATLIAGFLLYGGMGAIVGQISAQAQKNVFDQVIAKMEQAR